jgi:zeaxanthin glucosyltransferase
MTHYGIVCPSATGHLNPMTALGQELRNRGHQVTLLGIPDVAPNAHAAGLGFRLFGETEFPAGALNTFLAHQSTLTGRAGFQHTVGWITRMARAFRQHAPTQVRAAGIDALLVDQISPEGGTVAELLDIPFVTISSALLINQEYGVPPSFTPWQYDPAWWARCRNRLAYGAINYLARSVPLEDREFRRQHKLALRDGPNAVYSRLAQLSQQPRAFEFPREELPGVFHFTGPFINPGSRRAVEFPWDRLGEKPLVYASMGTVQNQLQRIWERIARSCADLDVQLVISIGDGRSPDLLPQGLPGSPLAVGYAPQLELLRRATATITHAGLNTTLESLSEGVPMVAIPVANDQVGVAARIAWTKTGVVVPLARLTDDRLRAAVEQVLTNPVYRQRARALALCIREAGGVRLAADIVEQAIDHGRPVLATNVTCAARPCRGSNTSLLLPQDNSNSLKADLGGDWIG